jgi:hypothetical protein
MVDRTLLYLVRLCSDRPVTIEDVNRQLAATGAVDAPFAHLAIPRALNALADAGWLRTDYGKSPPTFFATAEQAAAAEDELALEVDVRAVFLVGPAPKLPRYGGRQ